MKIKWNISGGIKYKDLILYYVEKYNLTEKYDITVFDSYVNKWAGGRSQCLYYDKNSFKNIVQKYNKLGVGFNITFSNHNISKNSIDTNISGNEQLVILNRNKLNGVIIVSPILEKIIRDKYKNLKIVLSIIRSISDKILYKSNKEIIDYYNQQSEVYDCVVLLTELNRKFDILENLKNKEKFELLVNHECKAYCSDSLKHHIAENDALAGECLSMNRCSQGEHGKEMIMSVEEFQNIKNIGFSNFKMVGRNIEINYLHKHIMKFIILNN